MNNYENNTCCELMTGVSKARTLSEMQGDAKCMGEQALELAKNIRNQLFGNFEEVEGVMKTDQTCYREVLERHCFNLEELLGALHDIAVRLGSIKE